MDIQPELALFQLIANLSVCLAYKTCNKENGIIRG